MCFGILRERDNALTNVRVFGFKKTKKKKKKELFCFKDLRNMKKCFEKKERKRKSLVCVMDLVLFVFVCLKQFEKKEERNKQCLLARAEYYGALDMALEFDEK